jgi:hypothetical protein
VGAQVNLGVLEIPSDYDDEDFIFFFTRAEEDNEAMVPIESFEFGYVTLVNDLYSCDKKS